mmetsp:Transcript_97718/g.276427  ORF Transcript_97718/g.276427 Transcript_97718/m.276427 type:complete len:217 (-) Transcript_97718:120-770(-)|eukprot:CAMPEP_0117471954 /NCGR_PEP_ID=MMETSP0784-20121206/7995_1 /TAXON_ID=39447 /ORGANISM="" /LENGTH=216 /DNA_ID=CAMNT_0005266085 /DNA_START=87 /DNA_END=737 /DNA_ORIENTATION=-
MYARYAAVAATSALGGAYISTERDKFRLVYNVVLDRIGLSKSDCKIDLADPRSVLAAAVRFARETPESCAVLSTLQTSGGVAARVVLLQDPFTLKQEEDERIVICFNTTRFSRKYSELCRDGRAAITYWNPTKLTYVTFIGCAEQVPAEEANELWRDWLRMFYKGDTDLYTAWRFNVSNIQVVSIGQLESHRRDWRAVELEACVGGSWRVVCDGTE